jgi:hypothetical protein
MHASGAQFAGCASKTPAVRPAPAGALPPVGHQLKTARSPSWADDMGLSMALHESVLDPRFGDCRNRLAGTTSPPTPTWEIDVSWIEEDDLTSTP